MKRFFSIPQLSNYFLSRWFPKSSGYISDPAAICLFVTDRCTLACKWCMRQSNLVNYINQRPDITLDQAKETLNYFPKSTHLGLAGFGEPLLVNDLFKIIAEFGKRPMKISMITNGTLLLDRMDEIVKAELHRISVSVNSLDSSEYQMITGGNEKTFTDLLNGIRLLAEKRKSKKPYLHLSFVLTRDLFNRTQEIIKFAEEINVDNLDLHNLIKNGTVHDYIGMLTNDDEEVIRKLSEWERKKYKVTVRWPKLVQKGLKKPARICKSSWDWLGVDMEGNTAGCSKAMPAKKEYGNLFQEGKHVWKNSFRKKLRKSFLDKNFLFECCKKCTEVQP